MGCACADHPSASGARLAQCALLPRVFCTSSVSLDAQNLQKCTFSASNPFSPAYQRVTTRSCSVKWLPSWLSGPGDPPWDREGCQGPQGRESAQASAQVAGSAQCPPLAQSLSLPPIFFDLGLSGKNAGLMLLSVFDYKYYRAGFIGK